MVDQTCACKARVQESDRPGADVKIVFTRCPLHIAAPELLGALGALLDATGGDVDLEILTEVRRKAYAAIAKAEGAAQ